MNNILGKNKNIRILDTAWNLSPIRSLSPELLLDSSRRATRGFIIKNCTIVPYTTLKKDGSPDVVAVLFKKQIGDFVGFVIASHSIRQYD